METKKNVFISHHGADDGHVQKFKDRLSEKGCQLRNSSVDSTKPNNASNEDYIKQIIRDGISWAGTFICLIGPETHQRDWVNYEIEQANKQGKPILGVFVHGEKETAEIPAALKEYETLGITSWSNFDRIIDALDGKDVGRTDSSGNSLPPMHKLDRVKCQ